MNHSSDFDSPRCLICLTSQQDDPSNNECVVLNTSCPTCTYYTHDSCFAMWFDKRNKCVWCRNRIEDGYDTPSLYGSDNENDISQDNLHEDDNYDQISDIGTIVILNPYRDYSIYTHNNISIREQQHNPAFSSSTRPFIHSPNERVYYNIYNCVLFAQFLGLVIMLYASFLVLQIFHFMFQSSKL